MSAFAYKRPGVTTAASIVKCRPTRNEVAEQQRINVFEPLKHLRVILFQRIAQSIGDTDPVIFSSGRNSLQLPTSVRYCLVATRVERGDQ